MKRHLSTLTLAAALVLLATTARAADEPAAVATADGAPEASAWTPQVTLHGLFTTMFLVRNDSDFDRTAPFYDADGQTEGQAATFFRPDLRVDVGKLAVFYQVELGWNAWSRNDPDQWFPGADDYLVLKHRELWAQWTFSDHVRFRAGYQYMDDPTRLFLAHWGGALRVDLTWDGFEASIVAGQLPDATYEGVDVRDNNFVHDNVLLGLRTATRAMPDLWIDAALYGVADFRVTGRPLWLGTGVVGLRYERPTYAAYAHLLGQAGLLEGLGFGGADQTILAWAAQLGARQRVGDFCWGLNVFLLSGDDEHDGNDFAGAFWGSAKNGSATLILTEDEYRDRYDNLDEQIGSRWGSFLVNRSGLVVGDIRLGYRVASFYHPLLILGAAANLNPDNALGNAFVGFEAALWNRFPLNDHVAFALIGQVLVPGAGASVFVNDIDREATDPIYGVQAGFSASF